MVVPLRETPGERKDRLIRMCNGCGRCREVCPMVSGGCDPLLVMTGKEGGHPEYCIGCGRCSINCPVTEPEYVMMYLKGEYEDTLRFKGSTFKSRRPIDRYGQ